MKALLTILFFVDSLALSVLSFLLLKFFDAGGHRLMLSVLLLLYVCCILLLALLLFRFLKHSGDQKTHSFFD